MTGLLIPLLAFQILQPTPSVSKWILEVSCGTRPSTYFDLPGGQAVILEFNRLPGAREDITAIGLTYQEQNGSVRVDVSAVTAPLEQVRNVNMSKLSRLPAGTYTLAMPGEVVAEGLREYKIEPIVMRVVMNKPDVPSEVETLNQTTSLKVESIEETRSKFEVALRNNGSRGVIALAVLNGGQGERSAAGPLPIIAPSAVKRVSLFKQSDAPARPVRLTIAAAFDDGSVEGEGSEIVESAASHFGWRMQEQKMAAEIQRAFESGREPKDAAALSALAAAVPLGTDTSALQNLLARAPSLSDRDQERVRAKFRSGVEFGRKSFLRMLEQTERVTASISMRDWWAHVRDLYLHGSGPR